MIAKCPNCLLTHTSSPDIVRAGTFRRKSDSKDVSRYFCRRCDKHFSQATQDPCFGQKKRRLNILVKRDLVSGVSMRQCARKNNINRKTVVRKKEFLARQAHIWLKEFLSEKMVKQFQFDDMESFEHTKLKPISITIAVEKHSRFILSMRVSPMPAKGLLVRRSIKKYGPRPDHRGQKRRELFAELQSFTTRNCTIESDQNPHYGPDVREFFPEAAHSTYKGRRGCVTGQGELKAAEFDPLFSLNHTAAMLRAHLHCLHRRTWCTVKKISSFEDLLVIYAQAHNERILAEAG